MTATTRELVIDIRSLTMRELWDIRQATGRSLLGELASDGGAVDEQIVAAIYWVMQRRSNADLTFDEVFDSTTIEDTQRILIVFGDPAKATNGKIPDPPSKAPRGAARKTRTS